MAVFTIQMPLDDRWYTKSEVARLFNISESTLDRLIAEGSFPRGAKVGKQGDPLWAGIALACEMYNSPAKWRDKDDEK